MLSTTILISVTLLSGICLIVFHRKLLQEFEKRYIESINLFNFWLKIDDLWKKSKIQGNESIKRALIGFLISFLALMLTVLLSVI